MISDRDIQISVVALALQRRERLSASAVSILLAQWRSETRQVLTIDEALDLAQVPRSSIAGSISDAARDIERGLKASVFPIPISSDLYPDSLRTISDAPPVIFFRGNLEVLKSIPGVAVVGTRKASPHGLLISSRLAEHISTNGWVVVSGLALGIDAAAHEGALRGGMPTIAVLAHGLEKAQPIANQPLAQRILDANGAWISEHALGIPAKPAHFVWRNRIQVGLSCASVIVEGEEKSGSATQAEFCLRNRRTLFAVMPEPGSRVATVSALPKMLVSKRGAHPIFSKADYPSMMGMIKNAVDQLRR
ncbi:DNA-processing protein DprA [Hydrogenophaga taeniospiralis]|uniref:DNA-processing protein DprA n=1 Tax=Hydrogenophaga taeniospiralis TaxID=65656 RepID=UPI001CFB804C|nr:DNA-processing protein DprA [Hydrogenophaga taeniospiralis]UCU95222.1 DNA-protecting protein DprA [Hydrogenophaga taeniospiralis]